MPVSSGYGKWPTEYGVGVREDKLNKKCALCTQKGCFDCEHRTPVKNSIFLHEPYLKPNDKFSIADRNGTIAHYLKHSNPDDEAQNTQRGSKSLDSSRQTGRGNQVAASNQKNAQKQNGQNSKPTDQNSKPAKKSTCSIL